MSSSSLLIKQTLEEIGGVALTKESLRSLLQPDFATGESWYPGYYEKWFKNESGFIDHDNFVGCDETLGPICVSLQILPTQDKYISLVRSLYGFLPVIGECPGLRDKQTHSRINTLSLPSLAHKHKHKLQRYSDLLVNVMEVYVTRLKQTHAPASSVLRRSLDSGIDASMAEFTIEDNAKRRNLDMFYIDSISEEKLQNVSVRFLARCLELDDSSSLPEKLLSMERRSESHNYSVDVLKLTDNENESVEFAAKWNSLLVTLGKAVEGLGTKTDPEKSEWREDKAEQYAARRPRILEELLSTETNYVRKLHMLEDNFLRPLQVQNILSKTEFNIAFPRVGELIALHERMCATIAKAIAEPDMMIGTQLVEFVNELEIYKKYVKAHPNSVKKLRELRETKPNFNHQIEQCEKNLYPEKYGLNDLLIEPVQRVPRYNMLFKDLLKCSPPDNPDYQNLKLAYNGFVAATAAINNAMKEEESMLKAMDLLKIIDKCPADIVKGHRRFIKEYDLFQFDILNPAKESTSKLFLFNDCILISKVKRNALSMAGKSAEQKFIAMHEFGAFDIQSLKCRGFEDSFLIETNENSSQTHRLIRLEKVEDENVSHTRSLSSHSTNTATTGKSSDADHYKAMLCFRMDSFSEFLKDLRIAQTNRQSDASALILRKDIRTDIFLTYNVYKSLECYTKSDSSKSKCLILFHDHMADEQTRLILQKYEAVLIINLKSIGVRALFKNNDIFRLSEHSDDDSASLEQDLNEKVALIYQILDNFEPVNSQRYAQKVRSALQSVTPSAPKIFSPNSSPTKSEKIDGQINTSPLKRISSMLKSSGQLARSRRGSVASLSEGLFSHGSGGKSFSVDVLSEDTETTDNHHSSRCARSLGSLSPSKETNINRRKSFKDTVHNVKSFSASIIRRQSISVMDSKKLAIQRKLTEAVSIVEITCSYLEDMKLLEIDGIYAINNRNGKVENLLKHMTKGRLCEKDLEDTESGHAIAVAFKEWLQISRDLFWPLETRKCFAEQLMSMKQNQRETKEIKESLVDYLFETLSLQQLTVMNRLLKHIKQIVKEEANNFMNVARTADHFKNVFFPQDELCWDDSSNLESGDSLNITTGLFSIYDEDSWQVRLTQAASAVTAEIPADQDTSISSSESVPQLTMPPPMPSSFTTISVPDLHEISQSDDSSLSPSKPRLLKSLGSIFAKSKSQYKSSSSLSTKSSTQLEIISE